LLLSQGLLQGFGDLHRGFELTLRAAGHEVSTHPLRSLEWLQILAIFVACGVVSAGYSQGIFLGLSIGIVHWFLLHFILLRYNPSSDQLALLIGFMAMGVFSAIGGYLGSRLWCPSEDSSSPKVIAKKDGKKRWDPEISFGGRIAWISVISGAVLGSFGVVYAPLFLQKIMDLFGVRFASNQDYQERLLIWEMRGLAILVGGFAAGFGKFNGLKQAFFSGLFSIFFLILYEKSPFGDSLQGIFLLVFGILSVSLFGGWLGCQLFPPLVEKSKKHVNPY
ncbi:MAG: hypothetical protein ACKO23_13550, partial [Gemmataceae bacterium]